MKHTAVYSTAAMLGRALSFFMLPFYAHLLRGTGYAVIGMLDVAVGLLVTVMGYGASGALIRLYHDQKDPDRKPAVVSTGLYLVTGTAIMLVIPVMLLSRPVASLLFDDAGLYPLLLMALTGLVFEMGGQAGGVWLLIHSRSKTFAAINLLRLFLGLSLNIYLIVVMDMGLTGYFISSLVANILSNLFFFGYALRGCGTGFDRHAAREIRDFMLPLLPGNLLGFASRQVERLLVKFQIDLTSVGVLEMGYKFPFLIAQLITTPFMRAWDTRRFEMADRPDGPERIAKMFTSFLFLVVYAGLILAVLVRPVLAVLTPPEFGFAYRIAQIEILTLVLQGCNMHVIFGLFYAKHTGIVTRIRSVGAILKILLTWAFIHTWGLSGAAYSATAIAGLTLVITYPLAQRRYPLVFEWRRIGLILVVAGAMFVALTRWNATDSKAGLWIAGTAVPQIAQWFQGTFLATWKDGKALEVLIEEGPSIADILLKAPAALAYGLVLFAVQDSFRETTFRFLRRR